MKDFKRIETEIGYENPKMVVLISIDRGDYELSGEFFDKRCR